MPQNTALISTPWVTMAFMLKRQHPPDLMFLNTNNGRCLYQEYYFIDYLFVNCLCLSQSFQTSVNQDSS